MRARDRAGRQWALVGLAVPAMLGVIAGCSEILGIQSDRVLDAGLTDTASGLDGGPWGCLGQPPPLFSPNAMTTVTVLAVDALQPITSAEDVDGGSALDLIGYTPLPGLAVRACPSVTDLACTDGTATAQTDEAGTAMFALPQSWDGFYQLDDPDLFTTAVYPGRMLAGQTSITVGVPVLSLTGEMELEAVLPVRLSHDLDGGLGHVIIAVYDCQDHLAPGVQFRSAVASDESYPTTVFYVAGNLGQGIPSTTASSTDQEGAGGILNVPTGLQSITASLPATASAPARTLGAINVLISPGVAVQLFVRTRTE